MPCMEGIQKTDFLDEEDRSRFIQIMEEGMQMVWGRIERGHALPSDKDRIKKLTDILIDITDQDEEYVEVEDAGDCLWDGLLECANSFFVDEVFDIGRCEEAIDTVFHMVDGMLEEFLNDNLYERSPAIEDKNEELTRYIIGNHPVRIAEVNCPDRDIELVEKNYPHNMDEIMKRREEYHNRNIIDFKPLEEYGFHVEPVR